MKKLKVRFGLFVGLFLCFGAFAQIQYLPDDFTNIPVLESGLLLPTVINFDDSGQGYIAEKQGVIRILDTLGNLVSEPLIDISEEVIGSDDHGLIGFVLHPDFLDNGYFYMLYTVDRHHLMTFGTPDYDPNFTIEKQATICRITRYTADKNANFQKTIAGSRKILLGKDKTDRSLVILMTSHGAGDLEFGKNNVLYVSFGDSGSYQFADEGSSPDTYFQQALDDGILLEKENVGSLRAQMIDNLGGKILRLDAETGEGLPDNPYFDPLLPNAPKSKIWSLGLRNPFRFFVSEQSDGSEILYLGDVGSGLWEEMNLATTGGQNFGWPTREGMQRRWEHANLKTPNFDAPNPLFDGDTCEVEHFTYQQLFLDENKSHEYFFENPCAPEIEIPSEIPTFYHTRPVIAWSGTVWNKPTRARVPGWDEEGKSIGVPMSELGIAGDEFDGFSAIPAFIYEGKNFPFEYQNKVFVADFAGWIRTFEMDENLNLKAVELFMDRDTGIVDLKVNPKDGCVYYVHIYTSSVHKICFGGTPPPVVKIVPDTLYGPSPLTVRFDGSQTFSPAGLDLDFEWDFGDGNLDSIQSPEHVFTASSGSPETFEVVLTASDTSGNIRSKSVLISVNNTPPKAKIASLKDGESYPVSDVSFLKLEAEVSDNEHVVEDLNYVWQVFLQHNIHFHEEPRQTEKVGSLLIDPSGCGGETFWYRVKLTVEDAGGLSSTDEVEIYPFCEDPFFEIAELKAQIFQKSIELNWSPIFEENVERFDVQRTADFRFETIGSVNENSKTTYFFEDEDPIFGDNLYRLKVVRNDGSYEYSPKLTVKFPPVPDAISVYPNPTKGAFSLKTKFAVNERIELEIFDLLGRKVFEDFRETELGEEEIFDVDFNPEARGIYFYKIKNGYQIKKGKLLINR